MVFVLPLMEWIIRPRMGIALERTTSSKPARDRAARPLADNARFILRPWAKAFSLSLRGSNNICTIISGKTWEKVNYSFFDYLHGFQRAVHDAHVFLKHKRTEPQPTRGQILYKKLIMNRYVVF